MTRIAVLDDWQGVARSSADWSALEQRAEIVFFGQALGDADAVVEALAEFDIVIAMRERTVFPAEVIGRLPRLRMIALTGGTSGTLSFDACAARAIVVSNTGGARSGASTAELALALLLAAARRIHTADAAIRAGGFQSTTAAGIVLEGRTLGILGLGRIGTRMARYGAALGMEVVAWSQNLSRERAEEAGVKLVDRTTLFSQSDAISLHLVLSQRTHHIVGREELGMMRPGAILVNTSRGPLVDEDALVEALASGRLIAGLDVYDREPLPPDHPLRRLDNAVLSPHLGYCIPEVYEQFYRESIENVMAFLDGSPIRVVPASVRRPRPVAD